MLFRSADQRQGQGVQMPRTHLFESAQTIAEYALQLAQKAAFFVFVLVLLTLEDDTRQALLVTPLWFIALGLGWLFIGKKRAAELRK